MNRGIFYGPWFAAAAMLAGILLFALAGLYTFRQQRHVNRELCVSTVANRQADRLQWLTFEKVLAAGSATEQDRQELHALVVRVLEPIPELECVGNKPRPVGQ